MNFNREAGDDVEFRYFFTLNDDKIHWNYSPARKVKAGMESRLKRVRHVRDNKLGINCHVVSYAATGFPVVLKFEHEQHFTVMDIFNDITRDLFGVKGSAKPNPSGRATLGVDHGYLLREQLVWWLETGRDILGTIMRGLRINPFALGKDDNKRTEADDECPQNISP